MPINNVLVLGGGMCGVACAIALSKVFPTSSSHPPIKITIYELRPEPSTIGGAVNLTPAAIRCLDILGVLDELNKRRVGCEVDAIQLFSLHTGASLGVMDYTGPEGKGFDGYKGRRILRSEVLQAMLSVAEKIDNIEIVYSKKVIGLDETDEEATVKFEDGTTAKGDLVLGCDGIHSATRTTYVEPTRVPSYSGIASASGFTRTSKVIKTPEDKLFFKDTGLSMSRCGAFLTTFFTPDKDKLYLASVIEMKHQADKEGWRAKGKDQEAVKEDMMRRFGVSALPKIKEMLQEVDEWYLYPVFLLPPNGKWATKRVFLLGDAAHAVSSQLFWNEGRSLIRQLCRCRQEERA